MNQQSLLKQFEYSIPLTSASFADPLQTNGNVKHSSLFKLKIDFAAGILNFEGYRKYITVTNFHKRSYLINSNNGRLKIEAVIFPSTTINLNDPEADGMIFPMKGHVENANCLVPCSGFLLIEKTRAPHRYLRDLWNISCYIYDTQFTDFEITFKLPLSVDTLA
jgi:hypothetical protein